MKKWYYEVVITDIAVDGESLDLDCKKVCNILRGRIGFIRVGFIRVGYQLLVQVTVWGSRFLHIHLFEKCGKVEHKLVKNPSKYTVAVY